MYVISKSEITSPPPTVIDGSFFIDPEIIRQYFADLAIEATSHMPEKEPRKELEIAKPKQDNSQIWQNFHLVLAGIGFLIALAIIWWLPNQIEVNWLTTHPYQVALQIQASLISFCLAWLVITKDANNRVVIIIMILTIISTLASFIIPQVS